MPSKSQYQQATAILNSGKPLREDERESWLNYQTAYNHNAEVAKEVSALSAHCSTTAEDCIKRAA